MYYDNKTEQKKWIMKLKQHDKKHTLLVNTIYKQ